MVDASMLSGMTEHTLFDAARQYAECGWPVFPLSGNGKIPAIPATNGGRGYRDASTDPARIQDFWTRYPRANIGIPTGAASGFDVLDIDPRHGGDIAVRELIRQHGPLPATYCAITGGNGVHVLFRHAKGVTNSRGALPPGIDVRGDGGYIVAAPSVHSSGRLYRWHSVPGDPTEPANWPDWLLRMILARAVPHGRSPKQWRRLAADCVRPGERNNTIASYAGRLLRAGLGVLEVFELLNALNIVRCRPPLDEAELERTIASIARKEASRIGGCHGR